jgi:ankyrin repeat protein
VPINFLIQHGADVNARAGDGNTALSLATKAGHADIVTMLKAHGAK